MDDFTLEDKYPCHRCGEMIERGVVNLIEHDKVCPKAMHILMMPDEEGFDEMMDDVDEFFRSENFDNEN